VALHRLTGRAFEWDGGHRSLAPGRQRQPGAVTGSRWGSRYDRGRLVARGAKLLVAVAALGVTIGLPACGGGRAASAQPVVRAFLGSWSRGDYAAAGRVSTAPRAAASALVAVASGLNLERVSFRLEGVDQQGSTATAHIVSAFTVGGLGVWRFQNQLSLRRSRSSWRVVWQPSVIEPRLLAGEHLGGLRQLSPRATILDRAGRALFSPTPVVTVGVVPKLLKRRQLTLKVLQTAAGLDPTYVQKLVAAASPAQFVPLITLRRSDYEQIRARIHPLPGVHFQTGSEPLAPTRGFGRPLLGYVGQATADALRKVGPLYTAGDELGLSGLQEVFQRRLAGNPSGAVVLESRKGRRLATVFSVTGSPGRPVRVTLDRRVQAAAETALNATNRPAALVAVQASTGDLLAVANRPVGSYDRALSGLHPPGSSFKIVTTAALLSQGLSINTVVPCPPSIVVDGKRFTNFEGEVLGVASFSVDFAKSCNAAFISLAGRVTAGQLAQAGRLLGIGAHWRLPVPTATGQVPLTSDPVEHAADMIGQGRVLASPLAMALAAAAIASGRWHPPVLVTDPAQPQSTNTPTLVPAPVVTGLRQLMRLVVTAGTGTAANLPGVPVYGKTGTAEFGTGTPPHTHAWFIGFRGDIAFAVIVEAGGVGGQTAAPIAATFLNRISNERIRP
jgi:cell division protein FtsI/penicillin-binding protein 2